MRSFIEKLKNRPLVATQEEIEQADRDLESLAYILGWILIITISIKIIFF